MSNFQEFIENVKAGKIGGVKYQPEIYGGGIREVSEQLIVDMTPLILADLTDMTRDHLCAHIRRWLTGKDWTVNLHVAEYLRVYKHYHLSEVFGKGSELDWHIDAANWVIKQGVEG
jgi:hypothetical protein